ncbi:phenylalanine--tRNA ligase subunit alpha [Candidatus Woesebacteria bacterium]|nr:phenylalanine--tRNA ligase subunit alpha [Candidatus Woesebacteria bacterium]
MDDELKKLQSNFHASLKAVISLESLQNLSIEYLGRKGHINGLFGRMKGLSVEDVKALGQKINGVKGEIEAAVETKKGELSAKRSEDLLKSINTSLPGIKPRIGHLHPTTQTIRDINSFFKYLGFSVYEGPEIETDEYCFEKLNVPMDHPARDLQDTLYISEPEWLLRTQTSSVEAHALTDEKPPIRIVTPGKVYRNETSSTTNNSIFYQYQGLCVDKDISMANLRGTLNAFLRFLYGNDVKTRIRCKYYPEVEPGAGMDIQCSFCTGVGCQVCKYRGWVEVLGSGMVHPNTLKACGIDPKEYSGFAFGLGLDRLVMHKYGITDIRKLYSGALVFEDSL